jgi:Uma2 family endonuclease
MNDHATPIAKASATYEDILNAPDGMVAELINGALHLQPRPSSRHARASFRLAGRLDDPFENGVGGPGGWWFAFEPELHLGRDVLVPDIAGWQRKRMPDFPDVAAFEMPPDWVCEILSPRTREYDLTEKRAVYAQAGVRWLWFVDPDVRTLESFALENDRWVLMAAVHGDVNVRLPPFDAIAFPLGALWAPAPQTGN